jgi:uncharacterized membrane protein
MGEDSGSTRPSGDQSLEERIDRLERLVEKLWERDAGERKERPGTREPRSASPVDAPPLKGAPKSTDWASLGERLLGKVGIVFVVLALGFFLKYSFDQGWVTPMLRVILGLLLGAGLLVLGLRLEGSRKRYSQFLLGGAIAVFYIVGFAAFQLYELVPFALAFSYMAATTVLAVVLAERQDHASLATIGLIGALSTPFLLHTETENIAGLVLYTSLVMVGFGAVQFRRGWRSLLGVMGIGGLLVMTVAAFRTPDEARWITMGGVLIAWALVGISPILRAWLHAESPGRWPVQPLGWLGEKLDVKAEPFDVVLMHAYALGASLIAVVLIALIWDMEARGIGSLFILVGAVYCLLAWGSRGVVKVRDGSADTAAVLLPLGILILIQEPWAILPLAALATGYHLAHREWGMGGLGILGHLLFALLALGFMGDVGRQMDSSVASPLDLEAFALLGAVAMAFVTSLILPKWERPVVYQIAAHVALLAWLGVEIGDLPNGTGLVTISWGVYGILLFVVSFVRKSRRIQLAGLATLGLVAGKLLLVDMAQLDMIWRILLFMGFGAAFLVLSYYINRPQSGIDE